MRSVAAGGSCRRPSHLMIHKIPFHPRNAVAIPKDPAFLVSFVFSPFSGMRSSKTVRRTISCLNFRKEKKDHHAIGHCFISTRFLPCRELFLFAPTSLCYRSSSYTKRLRLNHPLGLSEMLLDQSLKKRQPKLTNRCVVLLITTSATFACNPSPFEDQNAHHSFQ